jgi:hypothetical protein
MAEVAGRPAWPARERQLSERVAHVGPVATWQDGVPVVNVAAARGVGTLLSKLSIKAIPDAARKTAAAVYAAARERLGLDEGHARDFTAAFMCTALDEMAELRRNPPVLH